MFVQSSHFIEDEGLDTMKRVTFYGHEKNETTAKIAQINLVDLGPGDLADNVERVDFGEHCRACVALGLPQSAAGDFADPDDDRRAFGLLGVSPSAFLNGRSIFERIVESDDDGARRIRKLSRKLPVGATEAAAFAFWRPNIPLAGLEYFRVWNS
jgi:hypothetical protein